MSGLILLDAGPLGLVTNPKGSDESRRCKAWLAGLVSSGVRVAVPEGADYEVRRDLFRAGRRGGLDRLDNLGPEGRLPAGDDGGVEARGGIVGAGSERRIRHRR